MCTAISWTSRDHYFGRTLDLDCSYNEEVCVLPRHVPLVFRHAQDLKSHFAMIGMATVADGVPLFYDAVNEHGLAIAGLHFPGNAHYASATAGEEVCIASFELIPWLLGQCKNVAEARGRLEQLRITDDAYRAGMPPAPLHWMLSDSTCDLVVEAMRDGMHLYENSVGVLTNNPPYDIQLANLKHYRHLRTDNALVARDTALPYETYCQGLGAVGLPGDVSSMSRFVRAAFGRAHSVSEEEEGDSVGQFFHLLSSVSMVRGICMTDTGRWDITQYTACMNSTRGRYYFTTYGNRRIRCVDLFATPYKEDRLLRFPLSERQDIHFLTVFDGDVSDMDGFQPCMPHETEHK